VGERMIGTIVVRCPLGHLGFDPRVGSCCDCEDE
jgi:hypothetical protein